MKAMSCSLIAGATLAGLIGCTPGLCQPTHPPPGGPPTICNAGLCEISVTVNDCGAIGGIAVSPSYLGMPMAGGAAVIHWKIITPGFVFSSGGIRFDPPNTNFVLLPGGPANAVRMRNMKRGTGDFYYFVDVLNCIPVDPFIQNF